MAQSIHRKGFTVVELSAVVLITGSVGAVLAPIGSQVQKANLDTKSQWVHHDLARRQFVYMGDHNGAFTGPNTSGAEWNRTLIPAFGNKGLETLEFDTAGGNPTTQGDWISPLVGDAYGFSPNRAERTQQRFEVVADPTTDRMVDNLYIESFPADLDQFVTLFQTSGFRQRSFLQINSFTHFSSEHTRRNVVIDRDQDLGYIEQFAVQNPSDVALSPEGYVPNISNVGTQLSNKVMFADGTRHYTDGAGLDFSIDLLPLTVLDSDPGPSFEHSTAYGRSSWQAPSQMNLELSYRKNGGEGFYVTMFDGSLQYMSREQSWTDPTPWYPSGSVWQGNGATPEAAAWVQKNLPGGVIH